MTKEYWEKEMAKWQASELSMAEFCRSENLSYWSFRQWRKKLQEPRISNKNGMVKLKLEDLPIEKIGNGSIEIYIGETRVVTHPDFDESHLLRLITALRKAS